MGSQSVHNNIQMKMLSKHSTTTTEAPRVLHKYQHCDRRATYSKQSVFGWRGITGSAVLSFQRNFSVNMQVTCAESLLLSIMCVPYTACTCSLNLAACFLTISVAHLQYLVLCIFLCRFVCVSEILTFATIIAFCIFTTFCRIRKLNSSSVLKFVVFHP